MSATRAARWLVLSVLLSAGLILGLEAGTRTDSDPAASEDTETRFVDNALRAIRPYEEDGAAARTALDCLTDDTRAAVLATVPASPGMALGDFLAVGDQPDSGCGSPRWSSAAIAPRSPCALNATTAASRAGSSWSAPRPTAPGSSPAPTKPTN